MPDNLSPLPPLLTPSGRVRRVPPLDAPRECKCCHVEREAAAFSLVEVRGVKFRYRTCNRCRARANDEMPAARAKRAFLLKLKSQPCKDCGHTFPPEAMDLDHVRGEKKFLLSTWRWHSLEELQAEADKGDVVCACCHRIRTEKRGTVSWLGGRPRGRPSPILAEVQSGSPVPGVAPRAPASLSTDAPPAPEC